MNTNATDNATDNDTDNDNCHMWAIYGRTSPTTLTPQSWYVSARTAEGALFRFWSIYARHNSIGRYEWVATIMVNANETCPA